VLGGIIYVLRAGVPWRLLPAKDGRPYITALPLAVGLSAANTHDSQLLEPMVDAVFLHSAAR
jgi:hypothetical protein